MKVAATAGRAACPIDLQGYDNQELMVKGILLLEEVKEMSRLGKPC